MDIVEPTEEELIECYNIEKEYVLDKDTDEKRGFFLPGINLDTYKALYKSAYIRVIKDKSSVIAFVIVIPPGHSIIENLFKSESMILFDIDKKDISTYYWIAKVAVTQAYVKQGFAQALYKEVEKEFSNNIAFTATAISPKRNFSSEKLHSNFGMKKCGLYLSKKNDDSFVSIVWRKYNH